MQLQNSLGRVNLDSLQKKAIESLRQHKREEDITVKLLKNILEELKDINKKLSTSEIEDKLRR